MQGLSFGKLGLRTELPQIDFKYHVNYQGRANGQTLHSPQRCRGRRQREAELAHTRTWSAYDRLITTWRRHELLHQFECFRRSPWAPIANRARHPRFSRFEPIAESSGVFSGTRGRRWGRQGSEIRVQHDAVAGLAGFKPGEGLVDFTHREVLGLRCDVVP